MAKTGASGASAVHKNIVFSGSQDNRSEAVQKAANVTYILESKKNWYCEKLRLKKLSKYLLDNEGTKIAQGAIMAKLLNNSNRTPIENKQLDEIKKFSENYENVEKESENLKSAFKEADKLMAENNGNMKVAKDKANNQQSNVMEEKTQKTVCPFCGKEDCSNANESDESKTKESPKRKAPKCQYLIGNVFISPKLLKNQEKFDSNYFNSNFKAQAHHMISFQRYIEAVGVRMLGDKAGFDINNGWGAGENGIELPAIKPVNSGEKKNLLTWSGLKIEEKRWIASKYIEETKKQWHVGDHSGIYDAYYLPYEKCVSSRLIEIEEYILRDNSKNCKGTDKQDDPLAKVKNLFNELMKDIKNDLDNFTVKSKDAGNRIFFTSQISYDYYHEKINEKFDYSEEITNEMENMFGKKQMNKFVSENLKV